MTIQETKRPSRRREPDSWPEWRDAVTAELLAQHGIRPTAIPPSVISKLYCTGRTAARLAPQRGGGRALLQLGGGSERVRDSVGHLIIVSP